MFRTLQLLLKLHSSTIGPLQLPNVKNCDSLFPFTDDAAAFRNNFFSVSSQEFLKNCAGSAKILSESGNIKNLPLSCKYSFPRTELGTQMYAFMNCIFQI
jgi:hypothetical protein